MSEEPLVDLNPFPYEPVLGGVVPSRLPTEGKISLTQIIEEMKTYVTADGGKLGNNLLDYLGRVSGVPKTPPIAITDYYGKSGPLPPLGGEGPSGTYRGEVVEYKTSGGNDVLFNYDGLWFKSGTGAGDPVTFGDEAGIYSQWYGASVDPFSKYVAVSNKKASFYNLYRTLRIKDLSDPLDQEIVFTGSWSDLTLYDMGPIGAPESERYTMHVSRFSDKDAGELVKQLLDDGKPIFLAVGN